MTDTEKKNSVISGIQFVSLQEHEIPSEYVLLPEVTSFWRKIFPKKEKENGEAAKTSEDLQRLSEKILRKVVPEINPEDYFTVFDELTEAISTQNSNSNPLFLVAKPFSKLDQVAGLWAEKRNRTIVAAPDINSDEAVKMSDHLPEDPWIITNLEEWFLRHTFGLNHIRALVQYIDSQISSNGIIICSSWAWSYLEHTIGLSSFAHSIYTLQSFDGELLARHFLEYAEDTTGEKVEFRNSSSGKNVLQREHDPQDPDSSVIDYGDFVGQLISHSRGNVEIATALWTKSLRTEPDEELEEDENQKKQNGQQEKCTFWVVPWFDIELPVVPNHYDWRQDTVLHTLLIHDGLSHARLMEVVPHTEVELARSVADLREQGLIERVGDNYAVAIEAYPSVREYLNKLEYLVDRF